MLQCTISRIECALVDRPRSTPQLRGGAPPLETQNYETTVLGCLQEHQVKKLQRLLTQEFEDHRPAIEARDNSTMYAELQHAASLVSDVLCTLASIGFGVQENFDPKP